VKTVQSLLTFTLLALPLAANAGHHRWIISEVFSNADGTIQFVELKGTANNEQAIISFGVETFGSTATGSVSLNGPAISSATLDVYYLIGTAGYAALATAQGAPAPDAVAALPNNFLETSTADTVRYAGLAGTDLSYVAGGLPTNGIDSLDTESAGTVNTPQNASGASGSINASSGGPGPALPRFGLILMVGLVVIGTSVMLRRRDTHAS